MAKLPRHKIDRYTLCHFSTKTMSKLYYIALPYLVLVTDDSLLNQGMVVTEVP